MITDSPPNNCAASSADLGYEAIHQWLSQGAPRSEDLAGLRQGIAYFIMSLVPMNMFCAPSHARTHSVLQRKANFDGLPIPIQLEGIDTDPGICVPRSIGSSAFDFYQYTQATGKAKASLYHRLLRHPAGVALILQGELLHQTWQDQLARHLNCTLPELAWHWRTATMFESPEQAVLRPHWSREQQGAINDFFDDWFPNSEKGILRGAIPDLQPDQVAPQGCFSPANHYHGLNSLDSLDFMLQLDSQRIPQEFIWNGEPLTQAIENWQQALAPVWSAIQQKHVDLRCTMESIRCTLTENAQQGNYSEAFPWHRWLQEYESLMPPIPPCCTSLADTTDQLTLYSTRFHQLHANYSILAHVQDWLTSPAFAEEHRLVILSALLARAIISDYREDPLQRLRQNLCKAQSLTLKSTFASWQQWARHLQQDWQKTYTTAKEHLGEILPWWIRYCRQAILLKRLSLPLTPPLPDLDYEALEKDLSQFPQHLSRFASTWGAQLRHIDAKGTLPLARLSPASGLSAEIISFITAVLNQQATLLDVSPELLVEIKEKVPELSQFLFIRAVPSK
ncbi:hypothetical protein M2243_001425 [Heliophilum fasciatum]|nr:hypothetical protein [Heliophilum fasciatum]MCW2277988.1 hypothetical protein [Heliophilum fasciatum]